MHRPLRAARTGNHPVSRGGPRAFSPCWGDAWTGWPDRSGSGAPPPARRNRHGTKTWPWAGRNTPMGPADTTAGQAPGLAKSQAPGLAKSQAPGLAKSQAAIRPAPQAEVWSTTDLRYGQGKAPRSAKTQPHVRPRQGPPFGQDPAPRSAKGLAPLTFTTQGATVRWP